MCRGEEMKRGSRASDEATHHTSSNQVDEYALSPCVSSRHAPTALVEAIKDASDMFQKLIDTLNYLVILIRVQSPCEVNNLAQILSRLYLNDELIKKTARERPG